MKVLEIGPGPLHSKGGMATVIAGIREDREINEKAEIRILESYMDGTLFIRFLFSVLAFIKFLFLYKQYDVFHIHMASYGSTFRKGIYVHFLNAKRKKIILHIHGAEYLLFYDALTDRQQRNVRRIWKEADTVIVLSEQWKREFEQIFHHPNIVIVNNGIDTEQYEDARCDIRDCRKRFLFLGRLGKRKGIYDLMEAVKIVKVKYPDIMISVAGDGEIEQIRQQVRIANLTEQIEIVGWVGLAKKKELMKQIATILLPSYNEGLPMTILEGMAAGKVIISTDVGSIPEVVESGRNGLIIKPGDIQGLADAMIRVIEDLEFDMKCSEENVYDAEHLYSRKIMHRKILEIMSE